MELADPRAVRDTSSRDLMQTFVFMACSSERKDFNGMCGMYTTMKTGLGIPDSRISLVFNGPRAAIESLCQRKIYIQQKHVHEHDVCFDSPHSEIISTAETGHQFEALASQFAKSAVDADSIIVVLSFHGVPNMVLFSDGVLPLEDAIRWIFGSSKCPTLLFLNKCASGETAALLVSALDGSHVSREQVQCMQGKRERQLVIYASSRSGRSLILPGAYHADADVTGGDCKDELGSADDDDDDRVCSSFLRASVLALGEVPFRRNITIGQHLDRTTEVIERLRCDKQCEPPAVFPLSARELDLDLFLPIESNKALDEPMFDYCELQDLMASRYVPLSKHSSLVPSKPCEPSS